MHTHKHTNINKIILYIILVQFTPMLSQKRTHTHTHSPSHFVYHGVCVVHYLALQCVFYISKMLRSFGDNVCVLWWCCKHLINYTLSWLLKLDGWDNILKSNTAAEAHTYTVNALKNIVEMAMTTGWITVMGKMLYNSKYVAAEAINYIWKEASR